MSDEILSHKDKYLRSVLDAEISLNIIYYLKLHPACLQLKTKPGMAEWKSMEC